MHILWVIWILSMGLTMTTILSTITNVTKKAHDFLHCLPHYLNYLLYIFIETVLFIIPKTHPMHWPSFPGKVGNHQWGLVDIWFETSRLPSFSMNPEETLASEPDWDEWLSCFHYIQMSALLKQYSNFFIVWCLKLILLVNQSRNIFKSTCCSRCRVSDFIFKTRFRESEHNCLFTIWSAK